MYFCVTTLEYIYIHGHLDLQCLVSICVFAGRQATWTHTWLNQPITLPLIFMSLPRFVIAAFNATSVFINTVPFMLFALMTSLGNLFRVVVSLRGGLILFRFASLAHKPL